MKHFKGSVEKLCGVEQVGRAWDGVGPQGGGWARRGGARRGVACERGGAWGEAVPGQGCSLWGWAGPQENRTRIRGGAWQRAGPIDPPG